MPDSASPMMVYLALVDTPSATVDELTRVVDVTEHRVTATVVSADVTEPGRWLDVEHFQPPTEELASSLLCSY